MPPFARLLVVVMLTVTAGCTSDGDKAATDGAAVAQESMRTCVEYRPSEVEPGTPFLSNRTSAHQVAELARAAGVDDAGWAAPPDTHVVIMCGYIPPDENDPMPTTTIACPGGGTVSVSDPQSMDYLIDLNGHTTENPIPRHQRLAGDPRVSADACEDASE